MENAGNKEILDDFRIAVNAVDRTEKQIFAVAGVASVLTFLTAGLSAGIAAAGGGGFVAGLFVTLDGHIDDADYYYRNVPRQR